MLNIFTLDLKMRADDNKDALGEIDPTINDIEDVRKSINNGQFDDAKQKINDASST